MFNWIKKNKPLLSFYLVFVFLALILFSLHEPKEAVGEACVYKETSNDLFQRRTTLTFIRSDAARGKLVFRDTPVDEMAPAHTFEWVALVLDDIPEIKPAATLFLKEKNIGALMHVYEEVFRLADSKIEKIENSDVAIRESQEKLERALLNTQSC